VTRDDFECFDLILALDQGHRALLHRMAPPAERGRVHLFLDFAPGLEGRDVPDPYYGGGEHFAEVLNLVERGAKGLLAEVRRRLA